MFSSACSSGICLSNGDHVIALFLGGIAAVGVSVLGRVLTDIAGHLLAVSPGVGGGLEGVEGNKCEEHLFQDKIRCQDSMKTGPSGKRPWPWPTPIEWLSVCERWQGKRNETTRMQWTWLR
jgi:hypothetical protein